MCCGRGRKKPENKKPKFHLVLSPRFLPAPCSAEGTGGSPPAIAPPAGSHPPTPPLTLMFLGGVSWRRCPLSLPPQCLGGVHPTPIFGTGPSPPTAAAGADGPGLSCRASDPSPLGSFGAPPSARRSGFTRVPPSLPGTLPFPECWARVPRVEESRLVMSGASSVHRPRGPSVPTAPVHGAETLTGDPPAPTPSKAC